MTWATRNGVRFYYERAGSGPPLLFISGTGADLRNRPNAFDYAFTSSFDTVAYDQRGLGQTDQPPGPYTMAEYADDAAGILDAAGLERAAVVGVSFGGMVAQELALRHPARVSRLVLACTSSGGAGGSSYPLHELAGKTLAERLVVTDVRWGDPDFVDPVRDSVMAASSRPSRTPVGDGARLQLEARLHHDTFDRLPTMDLPVLVAAGRYDQTAPVANAEALTGKIPGARLEIFQGGHLFLRQDPRAMEILAAFLHEQ